MRVEPAVAVEVIPRSSQSLRQSLPVARPVLLLPSICSPAAFCCLSSAVFCSVLALLLSWLPYVASQVRSSAAYFRLLLRLVQRRPSIRRWLIREGAIGLLLRFYTTAQPIQHFNYRSGSQAIGPHRGHMRDDVAASSPTRLFHPYRGHLALAVLSVLISQALTRRGQGKAARKTLKEALQLRSTAPTAPAPLLGDAVTLTPLTPLCRVWRPLSF